MSDQCKHCLVRGDWEKCNAESCFHHENWYSVELRKALAQREAECAEWKEAYETLTMLLEKRFPPKDGVLPDYKVEDVLKENTGLRERVKELEEANKGLDRHIGLLSDDKLNIEINEEKLQKQNADLTRQLEEYQTERDTLKRYIDNKDGLGGDCYSYSELVVENAQLHAQLEETRTALEPIREVYFRYKLEPDGYFHWNEKGFKDDCWNAIKSTIKQDLAALAGKENRKV